MNSIQRKLAAASVLIVTAVWIGMPIAHAFANRTIRFFSGQHLVGGPLAGRSYENLPSVTEEPGSKLCCRMLCCDFRFPLPRNTNVTRTESVSGGFDTIKGTIYVTNGHGGTVDIKAYAKAMRIDGFRVHVDGFGFTASSPDGGFVAAENSDPCKIAFSFFGDY